MRVMKILSTIELSIFFRCKNSIQNISICIGKISEHSMIIQPYSADQIIVLSLRQQDTILEFGGEEVIVMACER